MSELREEIGNPSYKSEADAFAKKINRNFKKRKNTHRAKEYFDDVILITDSNSIEYENLMKKLEKIEELYLEQPINAL